MSYLALSSNPVAAAGPMGFSAVGQGTAQMPSGNPPSGGITSSTAPAEVLAPGLLPGSAPQMAGDSFGFRGGPSGPDSAGPGAAGPEGAPIGPAPLTWHGDIGPGQRFAARHGLPCNYDTNYFAWVPIFREQRCCMPQHFPYPVPWDRYYYFRPYNFEHIAPMQQTVAAWGQDPRNLTDNRFFQKIYANMEARGYESDPEQVAPGSKVEREPSAKPKDKLPSPMQAPQSRDAMRGRVLRASMPPRG